MIQRINPVGEVQDYQTFSVSSPQATHWRDATCQEADCERYIKGWRVQLDSLNNAARFLIKDSGKHYVIETDANDIKWLVFSGGQQCFQKHRIPVGRPELYIVRDGDWRGNPTGTKRRHTKPEFWVEEMSENLDKNKTELEKG